MEVAARGGPSGLVRPVTRPLCSLESNDDPARRPLRGASRREQTFDLTAGHWGPWCAAGSAGRPVSPGGVRGPGARDVVLRCPKLTLSVGSTRRPKSGPPCPGCCRLVGPGYSSRVQRAWRGSKRLYSSPPPPWAVAASPLSWPVDADDSPQSWLKRSCSEGTVDEDKLLVVLIQRIGSPGRPGAGSKASGRPLLLHLALHSCSKCAESQDARPQLLALFYSSLARRQRVP